MKVCRRVLSLEEANAICEYARKASGDQVARDRLCSIIPPPPGTASTLSGSVGGVSVSAAAPVADTLATAPLAASSNATIATNPNSDAQSDGVVTGSETDPHTKVSVGVEPPQSTNDRRVGDVLSTLFKEADTENKVQLRNKGAVTGWRLAEEVVISRHVLCAL